MKVRGSQTRLSKSLRERVRRECKGSLCVRRNGQSCKTREFTVLTGFGPDHNLGVYNNSVDTIERAFAERSFLCKDGEGFRPAFDVRPSSFRTPELSAFRNAVMQHMPRLPVLTSQQVVDAYHGPKRRVYQAALYSLEKDELAEVDSHLSAFVKFEKQDVAKAPRVINPRAPRYNLRLGKYLKHSEHRFFHAINRAFGKRTHATVIKGFNADVSAQILREKWECFDEPIAIGLDASKFDMHVSVAALEYEHSFYTALFPRSKELRKLLKWQLCNKGVAHAVDGTVKFSLVGTRCSGDLNTSLGNCILMCSMIWAYARECGVDVELANNGDDCVVFLEKRDEPAFSRCIPSWFKKRGFAMTVEPTVDEFEQLEFCQTKPVQLSTGWRMVRKLSACLQKDPMCLLAVPNDRVYKKWLAAVGMCGGMLSRGVPVLDKFYGVYQRAGTTCSEGMLREVYRNRSQLQLAQGLAQGVVDANARVSFYYAFGVLPDEQVAMERFFMSLEVDELSSATVERGELELCPGFNIVSESNKQYD